MNACTRRQLVSGLAASVASAGFVGPARFTGGRSSITGFPASVAGVAIPTSPLSNSAIELLRGSAPSFLLNHSLRVFLFGSLVGRHDRIAYEPERLLVASCFHDLGLLPQFSSPSHPFEMDGADAAKRFMLENGQSERAAELVWNMAALHTSSMIGHYDPRIGLVSVGASVDFYGAYSKKVPPTLRAAVVEAFPRLAFKAEIQALLADYCRRKPKAQAGGWTDAFCQSHVPGVNYPTISKGLDRSPYSE